MSPHTLPHVVVFVSRQHLMLFVLGIQEMRFVANWLGLMVRDLVHGQEKHRAGAVENLGCRTYGE
eukprot:COSAG04_NODE_17888_length_456_cov_1.577031_1_plen_64_part_10